VKAPLIAGKTYHIYNRSISNELLFRCGDNYRFFLGKYLKYISPNSRLYAFCLMPNHFHFAIKIRSKKELINELYPNVKNDLIEKGIGFSSEINLKFSSFFNSYAKAYNKMYSRSGKLFLSSFKVKDVSSPAYLRNLIQYIHFNPVHHRFVKDPYDWTFSSIVEYQKEEQKLLDTKLIKDLFLSDRDYLEKPKFQDVAKIVLELDY